MMYCQRCGTATEERHQDGRLRPVCPACGTVTYLDPKLAVAVLIERNGLILLGRRAEGTREPGKWSFPAGFVERGEQVEAAAVREIREEVRLDITIGGMIGLYSAAGETVVLAVYEAARAEGEPRAADDLTAVGWFSPVELPELAFPHDRQILADWLASKQETGAGNPAPVSPERLGRSKR